MSGNFYVKIGSSSAVQLTGSDLVLRNYREVFSSADQEIEVANKTFSSGGIFTNKKASPKLYEVTFYAKNTNAQTTQQTLFKLQSYAEYAERLEIWIEDPTGAGNGYAKIFTNATITKVSVGNEHYNINYFSEITLQFISFSGFAYLGVVGGSGTITTSTNTNNITTTNGSITITDPSIGSRYTGIITIATPASAGTQIKLENSTDSVSVWVDSPQNSKTYYFDFVNSRVYLTPGVQIQRSKGSMKNFFRKGATYTFYRTGGSGTWTVTNTLYAIT